MDERVKMQKFRNKVSISVDLGHFSRAPLRLTKIKLNIIKSDAEEKQAKG